MVERYVQYVAEVTGLVGWSVRLTVLSGNPGLAGSCESEEAYKTVRIHLWPDAVEDEDELTEVIVHEVCHGTLTTIRGALHTTSSLMSKQANEATAAVLLEAEERACTQLSQGLIRSGAVKTLSQWREEHNPRMKAVITIDETEGRRKTNAAPDSAEVPLKSVKATSLFVV